MKHLTTPPWLLSYQQRATLPHFLYRKFALFLTEYPIRPLEIKNIFLHRMEMTGWMNIHGNGQVLFVLNEAQHLIVMLEGGIYLLLERWSLSTGVKGLLKVL